MAGEKLSMIKIFKFFVSDHLNNLCYQNAAIKPLNLAYKQKNGETWINAFLYIKINLVGS